MTHPCRQPEICARGHDDHDPSRDQGNLELQDLRGNESNKQIPVSSDSPRSFLAPREPNQAENHENLQVLDDENLRTGA